MKQISHYKQRKAKRLQSAIDRQLKGVEYVNVLNKSTGKQDRVLKPLGISKQNLAFLNKYYKERLRVKHKESIETQRNNINNLVYFIRFIKKPLDKVKREDIQSQSMFSE